MNNDKIITIKPLSVRARRASTYSKLIDYSNKRGGKELATVLTDI
jgi:hypothetical protein